MKKLITNVIIILGVFTVFSIQHTGEIGEETVKSRVGPDMIGWMASAQYLSEDLSMGALEEWMTTEYPKHPKVNAFGQKQFRTQESIISTYAYTKQVQAEFLLGSKRIGLPSTAGAFLALFPKHLQWQHVYLGLIIFFQYLIVIGLLSIAPKRYLPNYIVLSFSFPFVFTTFEGGLGQQFSLVIFIYCLKLVLERRGEIVLVIPLIAMLTSYQDFFFFTLPFLTGVIFLVNEKSLSYLRNHKVPAIICMIAAVGFVLLLDFPERIKSLAFGGWDEGWTPSLLDSIGIGGVYTWNSSDSGSRVSTILSIVITNICIYFLFRFIRLELNQRIAIILCTSFFSLCLIAAYFVDNNYLVWKILPYFTITNLYVFAVLQNGKLKRIKQSLQTRFLIAQILFSVAFSTSWSTQASTLEITKLSYNETLDLKSIIDKYALDFRDFKYVNQFALSGDMNWGIKSRQIQNQPVRTSPRKIVTIIPGEICSKASDKNRILFNKKDICVVDFYWDRE